MAVSGDLLFCGRQRSDGASLSDLLRHLQEKGVSKAVDEIPQEQFQELTDDELAQAVVKKLTIEPLALQRSEGEGKVTEQDVEVHSHWDGIVRVPGLHVEQRVPFTGEADLFELRPNTFDMNPPRGSVRGSSLVIGIDVRVGEEDTALQHIKGELDKVEANIERQRKDLEAYNERLRGQIAPAVAARRAKLQSASSLTGKMKGL